MTQSKTSGGRFGFRALTALLLVAVPVAGVALFGGRAASAWGARAPVSSEFRAIDRAAFRAVDKAHAPERTQPGAEEAEVEVSQWEQTDGKGSRKRF